MRPRWFAFLAFATAIRCGSTNPASTAPAALLPSAELAKSYGLALEPAPADGVPIRVVDAVSGKPVGDALVVSVDEAEFTYHQNDEVDVDGRGSARLVARAGHARDLANQAPSWRCRRARCSSGRHELRPIR
jgi:hypothetical protein